MKALISRKNKQVLRNAYKKIKSVQFAEYIIIERELTNSLFIDFNGGIPKMIVIKYRCSSSTLPIVKANGINNISYEKIQITNRAVTHINSHILDYSSSSKFKINSICIYSWDGTKIYCNPSIIDSSEFDKCESNFDEAEFYFNKTRK